MGNPGVRKDVESIEDRLLGAECDAVYVTISGGGRGVVGAMAHRADAARIASFDKHLEPAKCW